MSRIFTITHTFNAPRDFVWNAWTKPELFGKWFGPKGCVARVHKLELRTGGILHSSLTMPGGPEMWAKFSYREVTPPKRLVWEHSFSNKDGGITRHPFHASWPLKLLTTVNFEEQGNQTKITLTWEPLDASEAERKTFENELPGMNKGWGGTFEQLETFLQEAATA
jgi:uncharacterized protein YndB with AHSA1/START domain